MSLPVSSRTLTPRSCSRISVAVAAFFWLMPTKPWTRRWSFAAVGSSPQLAPASLPYSSSTFTAARLSQFGTVLTSRWSAGGPANARRSASGAPATCLGSKYPSRRRSYEPVRLRVVAEGGWLADVACSEARSVVEEGRYDFCRVVRTYHRCSRSVGVACRYRGPRSRDRRNASTTEAQHGVTSPARHAVFAEPHRQPPSGTGPAHGLAVAHDAHVPVGVQVLRGRRSILFGLHATHQADPHDVIVGSCYDACPGNQSRSHAANPTRLEPSVPHTSRVRRGALVNKHWAANPAPKPASALATARRPRAYASASTPSATMCCASPRTSRRGGLR